MNWFSDFSLPLRCSPTTCWKNHLAQSIIIDSGPIKLELYKIIMCCMLFSHFPIWLHKSMQQMPHLNWFAYPNSVGSGAWWAGRLAGERLSSTGLSALSVLIRTVDEDRRRRVNGVSEKKRRKQKTEKGVDDDDDDDVHKVPLGWQSAALAFRKSGHRRGHSLAKNLSPRTEARKLNWHDSQSVPASSVLRPLVPRTFVYSFPIPQFQRPDLPANWQQFMLATTVRRTLHKIHFRAALLQKWLKL